MDNKKHMLLEKKDFQIRIIWILLDNPQVIAKSFEVAELLNLELSSPSIVPNKDFFHEENYALTKNMIMALYKP
ncbi:hypothetical protein YC2023_096664 [Brassica napus]